MINREIEVYERRESLSEILGLLTLAELSGDVVNELHLLCCTVWIGGWDSSVGRAPNSLSENRGFDSRRREIFNSQELTFCADSLFRFPFRRT